MLRMILVYDHPGVRHPSRGKAANTKGNGP